MADTLRTGSVVFMDGKLIPHSEAQISVLDEGLLFGFGFFETFRTSGGRPHHWRFHRARLEQACVKSGLVLPRSSLALDESKLQSAIRGLLRASSEEDAAFRYSVTAGAGDGPREFLMIRPLPSALTNNEINLRVLSVRRDTGEWIPRPKSLNYLNATLGLRELQSRPAAASDEGLFLSREGSFVTETPRQSVLWILDGRLFCPVATLGCVAGTCMAWMLSRGETIEPVRATLPQLLEADAIFACNAVRGISPVREVWDAHDATKLGSFNSVCHPMVVRLQRDWIEALRETAEEPGLT